MSISIVCLCVCLTSKDIQGRDSTLYRDLILSLSEFFQALNFFVVEKREGNEDINSKKKSEKGSKSCLFKFGSEQIVIFRLKKVKKSDSV